MINEINSIQVEGTLVLREDTVFHSDRFKSRQFILEVNSNVDGEQTIDYLKMKLVQEGCDLMDDLRSGYRLTVTFKITGRKWKSKTENKIGYFTNLEALNIEVLDDSHNFEKDIPMPQPKKPEEPDELGDEDFNDLPF
jgi:hypothetical protein